MDRTCRDCGQLKPIEDYYVMGGIPALRCKICHRLWRKKHDLRFYKRHKTTMITYAKKWKRKNPKKVKIIKKKWKDQYPEKFKAQYELRRAVAKGIIDKPRICEGCNNHLDSQRIYGHHHLGYNKDHWYDIKWLCAGCHALAHR